MTEPEPPWLAHRRKLFMRPDAHRYLRPDYERFVRPGSPAQKANFDPNQPRDEIGRWTDANGNNIGSDSDGPASSNLFAGVIRICVAGSKSLSTDYRGNKMFTVTYECVGGRTIERSGNGHRFPGFIIDPFQ